MPVAAGNQAHPPVASQKPGINSLVILAVGLALIALIAVIIFVFANDSDNDTATIPETSTSSQPTNAPNARIVGSVVKTVGTPAKVDYLVIAIENPANGTPLSITNNGLTILYQDAINTERISYPRAEDHPGWIANSDDNESIDACSDLARGPSYKGIWCYLTDGTSNVLNPGASGEIYIFIGGLAVPLGEDSRFQVDLISAEWQQTLMGQTPTYLEPISPTAVPTPTVMPSPAAATQPAPTEAPPAFQFSEPISPPVTPMVTSQAPSDTTTQVPTAPVAQADPATVGPVQTDVQTTSTLSQLPAKKTMTIPHSFHGKARKSGNLVPMGTKVTVWVAGYANPVAETKTTVSDALGPNVDNYALLVYQHGSVLDQNSSLIFHIGGVDTGQVHSWEEGGADRLDLTID